jgi:hypothetical protein
MTSAPWQQWSHSDHFVRGWPRNPLCGVGHAGTVCRSRAEADKQFCVFCYRTRTPTTGHKQRQSSRIYRKRTRWVALQAVVSQAPAATGCENPSRHGMAGMQPSRCKHPASQEDTLRRGTGCSWTVQECMQTHAFGRDARRQPSLEPTTDPPVRLICHPPLLTSFHMDATVLPGAVGPREEAGV